ncbi:MAG TPA: hypothetical protein VN176_11250 [Verrucomicrobiae bacterium]|nr:hypothetical protein [Verrucomicrobiae bacterium]
MIERHQPVLWVYGHTHECDDQTIGKTRIISNQLGYLGNSGAFECRDIDEAGLPIDVSHWRRIFRKRPGFPRVSITPI